MSDDLAATIERQAAELVRLREALDESIRLMSEAALRAGYAEGQNRGLRGFIQVTLEVLSDPAWKPARRVQLVCDNLRAALATDAGERGA